MSSDLLIVSAFWIFLFHVRIAPGVRVGIKHVAVRVELARKVERAQVCRLDASLPPVAAPEFCVM